LNSIESTAARLPKNKRTIFSKGVFAMKYDRVYNFSAGPSILPVEVLESVRDNLLNYEGSGMYVMEMSHRSKVFQQIIDEAEQDLRDLMNIPDNYKVMFIQGGATLQFAMLPMNLMKNGVADYIVTGNWSKKAYNEAKKILFGFVDDLLENLGPVAHLHDAHAAAFIVEKNRQLVQKGI